jgi:all-trans-retinol 13,14-reductase
MKIYNIESTLQQKTQLYEDLYDFKYSLPPELSTFISGQFIGLKVLKFPTRAYSIVDIKDNLLTLLIDVETKSNYFRDTLVGDSINVLGPYGIYRYKETPLNKVFIATGAGLAPFIPMIKDLYDKNFQGSVSLFFGMRYIEGDVVMKYYLNEIFGNRNNFNYYRCVTMPQTTQSDSFVGRVTSVVPLQIKDYINTEFYICGSTEMVNDMAIVLKDKGADKIYFEKYG